MELFIVKARQGLNVFLICDKFGSSMLHGSPLVKELRKHGGRMHFYNAMSWVGIFTPWRWFPRTHTKTLLIDSTIAYTGGVCMAERMHDWRDTHVRVTGPVTAQIRQAFDDIENKILRRKSKGISKNQKKNRTFFYLLNRPKQQRHAIYKELSNAVRSARNYIYITSAFFIPNRRFVRLLKRAHARGVDVRVLVPERSDVLLADWLCLSYTRRFFDAGLRIFHYQENILHSKTAIIDDNWGTVGSMNFDILSFFHNREANMVIKDTDAIADLKKQFLADLEKSIELTDDGLRNTPLWKKIIGYMARILRAFF